MASSLRSRFFPRSRSRSASREPKGKNQSTKPGNGGTENVMATISSSSKKDTNAASTESYISELFQLFSFRNLKTLKDVAVEGISGEDVDDKTYLMERIIQLAADLPVTSSNSQTITKAFLSQLWNDLQHPPLSYLGDDYIYRKPDGSYNNILWPHIGAAGQPYARSVQPKMMQPVARPDPGLVFDSLLARKDFIPHPNKISSVLFYMASIIIHDIFHTSHTDFGKSETSSYLDLAPLYGSSEKDQNNIRTKKDGKLKADCFSDKRILGFPPGVGLLLVMFNRFHNHVVENLARIDENSRFSSILKPVGHPPPENAEELYDEALFQTGRLVTTGLYSNIILKDYVRTILNLNRVDSLWNLDPRSEEGKSLFLEKIPEATGNQVSAEFNLVYRWHSCVSERDDQWTRETYKKIFGKETHTSLDQFLRALQAWAKTLSDDPQSRPFADLERDQEGKFNDDILAAMWTSDVNDVAGSFGAKHVPSILRDVEILGIIQARAWNLASLNEFRQYFKLKPHEKFEDINPDPEVAGALKKLYGHPDNVELYPGVIVESTKEPKKPGSGLCTTFTISRAILSDAVALVRGDRFYTVDYTPKTLTNWGFKEASYDLAINYGCVLYKLVLTALPNNFSQDSIYAHYPFVVSEENRSILKDLKLNSAYNFTIPAKTLPVLKFKSFQGCANILGNPSEFSILWEPAVFTSTETFKQSQAQQLSVFEFLPKLPDLPKLTQEFYDNVMARLLKGNSFKLAGSNHIDIVGDVMNVAHLRFVARLFCLPLQSDGDNTVFTDAELLHVLKSMSVSIFNDLEPAHRVAVARSTQKEVRDFAEKVTNKLESLIKHQRGYAPEGVEVGIHKCGLHSIEQLAKKNLSAKEIVWTYSLPAATVLFTILTRLSAQSINFILSDRDLLSSLQDLSKTSKPESSAQIERYVLEVRRLCSSISLVRKTVVATTISDAGENREMKSGQVVLCDLSASCYDSNSIKSPEKLVLDREMSTYSLSTFGPEIGLSYDTSKASMLAILKVLGNLEGLSKVAGPEGRLKRVSNDHGVDVYMNAEESEYQSFPNSLKISWKA